MSEVVSAEPTTTEGATDETAKSERKRVRHRKKQLYDRILRQMEFYFSDANLTKDRFLSELTRADPAVPIEVFLKFNKIRALTNSVSDIAKAISNSSVLVCSEDKTKVHRVTPVRAYDAELRTVYVESVPAKASREWLEEVFREYGRVAYISLPKFNNSQRIKGFAFVEFEKPEDAQKCLSAFTKMGCKLPTCMPPEDLSTIKTFSADQPDESDKSTPNTPTEESKSLADSLFKREKENQERSDQENQYENMLNQKNADNMNQENTDKLNQENDDNMNQENTDKLNQENDDNMNQENTDKLNQEKKECSNKEKRKRHAETAEVEPPKKKQKGNKKKKRNETADVKQTTDDAPDVTIEEDSTKTSDSTSKDKMEESLASSQDESSKAESKKKCRKRTAKERNKSKNIGNTEAPKPVLWGLQVLSKTEWRILRNKYLNLQRKHMKELKSSLRMKGVHRAPAHIVQPHTQPERRQAESEVRSAEGVRGVERVEGVFVKVELPEPCLDVRLTKRQVRSNVHVQHVDVKEGQTDMCVRFDTPEAAAQYCSSGIYSSARVLLGQESLDEWTRATEARGSGGAGRRARGRTRLLQRAAAAVAEPSVAALPPKLGEPATHIHFEE